ncbi:hypothetical protein D3C80_1824540 [compost metagenome]
MNTIMKNSGQIRLGCSEPYTEYSIISAEIISMAAVKYAASVRQDFGAQINKPYNISTSPPPARLSLPTYS